MNITFNINAAGVDVKETGMRLDALERWRLEMADTYDTVKAQLEALQQKHATEKAQADERFANYESQVTDFKGQVTTLTARVAELEAAGPQLITQLQLDELGNLARAANASAESIVEPLNPTTNPTPNPAEPA